MLTRLHPPSTRPLTAVALTVMALGAFILGNVWTQAQAQDSSIINVDEYSSSSSGSSSTANPSAPAGSIYPEPVNALPEKLSQPLPQAKSSYSIQIEEAQPESSPYATQFRAPDSSTPSPYELPQPTEAMTTSKPVPAQPARITPTTQTTQSTQGQTQAQATTTAATNGNGSTKTITADSQTLHVQAGSSLTIAFETPMDSRISNASEPFIAQLVVDLTDKLGQIILPQGSTIRGRIAQVKRPGLFSRGGAIDLAFDHVVMPTGDLLPLKLEISTDNENVNRAGNLYSDPGIGFKVKQGAVAGKETFDKVMDAGMSADGAAKIITVPGAAVVGAVGGTAVTTGKALKALIGKGDSVIIEPGDTLVINFAQDGVL